MDRGEPEGLAPRMEHIEIAASTDHAVVEADDVPVLGARVENRLYGCLLLFNVNLLDLAPDELAPHLTFDHGLDCEGERVKVCGLHEATQNTRRVLKELLRIDDGNVEAAS